MNLTPLEPWIDHKIDRADLETYQLRKLNETLRLVKNNSRFYRHTPIDLPSDFGHLSELNRWPFTTAADLRADPFAFVCVSQDDIQRVVTLDDVNFPLTTLTTSGTTGQPKRLYFTREDQELTIDFFHIGMSTFTAPGDRVLILLPGETPGSVGDLLATGLQRLGAIPIRHGPVRDALATLDVMRREKIDVIVGVPTHVLALARHSTKASLTLKSVLLSTDHVSSAIKHAIEDAFSCTVYNHYGMTEMGLGGGVDCEARRGYHLREADMLFEIINPTTGHRVPDGEYGEVVFTTLTRRGMPLVRYRTGDVSRFIPGKCSCGTHLKTLERITHRLAGRVFIGDRPLTMADLDEALFAIDGVLNFTATLIRNEHGDELQLAAKTVADVDVTATIKQALMMLTSPPAVAPSLPKSAVRFREKGLGGEALSINVLIVPDIPPSMAKRTILDRRPSA